LKLFYKDLLVITEELQGSVSQVEFGWSSSSPA
jgi:hypothetical protein